MTELAIPQPSPGTVHPTADTPPAATAAESVTVPQRWPVSPTAVALALANPAVTGCMLALARHWSDHGARHSIGDMVPLTVGGILGLVVTGYAAATRDPLLVGTCGALTAAALGIGMMAYPTGLAEPLITAGVATVAGWVSTRRQWRAHCIRRDAAEQRQADRDHEQTVVGMQCQTAIEVNAIRQQGKTDRRKLKELGKTRRLELHLDLAEFEALRLERDTRRRHFMTVSPTATAALDAEPVDTTLGATAREALGAAAPLAIEPDSATRSCTDDDTDAVAVALGLLPRSA
ncbi:MAG: hypothetical protein ACJ786_04155 [Catenulispora sp.]